MLSRKTGLQGIKLAIFESIKHNRQLGMGYLGFPFTISEEKVTGNLEENVFQKENTYINFLGN